MDLENPVLFLEEVSPDQIEVEVETSETYLLDPLLDHNYNLTEPRQHSYIPHNVKIRELKALYHCSRCGFATLKKASMDAHALTHKDQTPPKTVPQKQYIPCPSCNVKEPDLYERCTECSYFTKKKTSLKIHMRIHMKDKPYKCTECEHRVQNLKELIRHYEDAHRTFEKYRYRRNNLTVLLMFCIQEKESHTDPFSTTEKDPLAAQSSSDDEPALKRLKTFSPSLNLKVYQIPAFNKGLSIFPTPDVSLPKFVNNPLNLANPLAIPSIQAANVVKSLHSRYSLPAKLSITPVQTPKSCDSGGGIVRYKKNGEVAKKRGPPKGYKRKPKVDLSQSLNNGALLQAQNTILTSLLAATNTTLSVSQPPKPAVPKAIVPQIKVPAGVELVQLELDPADWFPAEPYRMVFSRKKNPKWKTFPYRCEHCFKGYRVASTLLQHSGSRHGCVPAALAVPCPCCPHVSPRRKLHTQHLATHEGRRRRIFCVYCLPPRDPSEPYVKESEKYPYDKFPQYWYASEESLRLHKKRKHPYAGMLHYNWFNTWTDAMPNS